MIIGVAVVLALLFASPSTALRPTLTHNPCPRHVVPSAFEEFAESVWRLPSWERGPPKAKTIAAAHHQIYCARGTGRRGALKHRWREAQRAFYERRRRELRERAYIDAITPPGAAVLAAIRSCESGGVYSTATGNGFWGAYQFTLSTWAGVGGRGLPSDASPREQDERAARLYRERGSSPWPICGV